MIKSIYSLCLVTCFFLWGCQKENKSDYRDKYCGKWKFEVSINKYNVPNIGDFSNENYTTTGFIEKVMINHLYVYVKKDYTFLLEIDEFGQFKNTPYKSNLKFTGDNKLELYYYSGGLGGGVSQSIIGEKIY